MSDDFYRAFEERHRGSRECITERLKAYQPFLVPFLGHQEMPLAVDFGCGRGEWLEYLESLGFDASGVDLDEGMLAACEEQGLSAKKGEMIQHISHLSAESASVLSAFHVIEHIAFDDLRLFVEEAMRVLKPGGLLIMETPNPENISVATFSFHMDPTHNKPIPADLLSFVAEHTGFQRVKVLRLQEEDSLKDKESITLQDWVSGASPDYAVVAQKEALPEFLAEFDAAFEKDYGISRNELTLRWDQRFAQLVESFGQLQSLAEESNKRAEAAEARAEAAENRAQEAESSAGEAEIKATKAEASAGEAEENAVEARSRATQAEKSAKESADDSEKANISASEARTRADFAETRAEFAETRAELAQTSASEAKAKSDQAESYSRASLSHSEQALSKATDLELRADEIEHKVGAIERRADWVEEKADAAEARSLAAQEAEAKAAAAEAQANEAYSRACEAEAIAHEQRQAVEALLSSRSWRVTGPLRFLADSARKIRPGKPQPKNRIRLILEHAALYIGRRPRLKRIVVGVLNRFPRLRAKLFPIAVAAHFPSANVNQELANQDHPDGSSEQIDHLSPRAQAIYCKLKTAVEGEEREH